MVLRKVKPSVLENSKETGKVIFSNNQYESHIPDALALVHFSLMSVSMKAINFIKSTVFCYLRIICNRALAFLFWLALSGSILVSCGKKPDPDPAPTPDVSTATANGTVNTKTILDAPSSVSTGGQGTLTYAWTIKSAPADSKATLLKADSLRAELIPDKPGTYVLVLTITDATGQKKTTELTINVSLPGKPPVISVATSTTVETGKQTAIDASKSSDPDGDKLTYAWAVKTKPTGSNAALTDTKESIAKFTADVAGTYVLSLTVTDGIWPAVSQDVSLTATTPAVRSVNGSWTAADGTSGGPDYSPRNRFYSFDVATSNQPVSLTLTSPDINVGIRLYDQLGNLVLDRGTDRSVVLDKTLNAGTYSVMVYTSQKSDVGTFRLAGSGLAAAFTPLPTTRLQATNVSFGDEGGGGGFGNRPPISPRNHFYTFDITEDNAPTEINVSSADVSVWLVLRAPTGEETYTYGTQPAGTPRTILKKFNKGTYGLYIGTGKRDDIGKYSLEVTGKVQNLKQTVYNSAIQAGSYVGKKAAITYTLTVTEDNSVLDVSLRSPDIVGNIDIYNPSGIRLDYSTAATNYVYAIEKVNKGTHKIVVTPGISTSGTGNYRLSVYGKFSDLKKQ